VLDIVIHRYIELPQTGKNLELLLECLGKLYKFHSELTQTWIFCRQLLGN